MSQDNGPLPSPPVKSYQGPGQQRQRAKSSFSFHSHKSSGSGGKIDLSETHQEKESHRLQSKADPTMAINEAEPSAVAREATSTLGSIREIQHRDKQGNMIAEPDRNNPTRSRWERPLDTIRSFEAAIDGGYTRKSYIRSESDSASSYNRRSSYYGGTQVTTDDRQRPPTNGYYGGGRASSYRPESTYGDGRGNSMARPDSYYNSGENGAGPSNSYFPNRARYPRTASEPHFNAGAAYPPNVNPHGYETVTTGSGSTGDPAGYSTDPSSENSSVDRIAPVPAQDPRETYGIGAFGNNPQYGLNEQYVSNGGPVQPGNGYPVPPPHARQQSAPRVPIKLGATSGNAAVLQKMPSPEKETAAGDKRKSWFGKRFSKSKA